MKKYIGDELPPQRPRNNRILGLTLLLLGAVVGGVALGGVYYLSTLLVYLIFVSPLFAGVVAMLWFNTLTRLSKTRSRIILLFAGMLMIAVMMGAFWVGNYVQFLNDSRAEIEQANPTVSYSDEDIATIIDSVLQDEVDQTGFIGYMIWNNKQGMLVQSTSSSQPDEITHFERDENGNPYTYTTPAGNQWGEKTTLAYRLAEVALILGFTVIGGIMTAKAYYSEETGRWLTYKTLGYVSQQDTNAFMQAIQQGDYRSAVALLQSKHKKPRLEVKVGRFHSQAPDAILWVDAQGKNTQKVIDSRIAKEVYDILSG